MPKMKEDEIDRIVGRRKDEKLQEGIRRISNKDMISFLQTMSEKQHFVNRQISSGIMTRNSNIVRHVFLRNTENDSQINPFAYQIYSDKIEPGYVFLLTRHATDHAIKCVYLKETTCVKRSLIEEK